MTRGGDLDFWPKLRRNMIAWWAHQRRLAAEWWLLQRRAGEQQAMRRRKQKPAPTTATPRRQQSRQTAMRPPVIAPSRTAISWLLGYIATAVLAAFRGTIQAFHEPVEPRLRDYDDLIKSLNARRRAAELPPVVENKWRDPNDEYLKPRRARPHAAPFTQQPCADPVPVDGEGAYELLPPDPDDNDGPRGGLRL